MLKDGLKAFNIFIYVKSPYKYVSTIHGFSLVMSTIILQWIFAGDPLLNVRSTPSILHPGALVRPFEAILTFTF